MKIAWNRHVRGGGQATPIVYAAGGKQYLVLAGGRHFMETPVREAAVAHALP